MRIEDGGGGGGRKPTSAPRVEARRDHPHPLGVQVVTELYTPEMFLPKRKR